LRRIQGRDIDLGQKARGMLALSNEALCARRERPRGRAAEQRDERAPPHSITSSAATSSLSGTVRPSILAVWGLMTSSNLVDRTTGRAEGDAPLRMRPV